MTPMMKKGVILLVVQLLLVGSLAAKYFADRARYPRVWVRTVPYDPNLPIRGRYVTMSVLIATDAPVPKPPKPRAKDDDQPKVNDAGVAVTVRPPAEDPVTWRPYEYFCAELSVKDGKLFGKKTDYAANCESAGYFGRFEATLQSPLAYFIPDTAKDPSRVERDEELWVEVTVPPKGPPRPIRLGVKKGEGEIRPLEID